MSESKTLLSDFGVSADGDGSITIRGFEVDGVKYTISPDAAFLYRIDETEDELKFTPCGVLFGKKAYKPFGAERKQ